MNAGGKTRLRGIRILGVLFAVAGSVMLAGAVVAHVVMRYTAVMCRDEIRRSGASLEKLKKSLPDTPPPPARSGRAEYMLKRKEIALHENVVKHDSRLLEYCAFQEYEIYFAVVIDVLFILGGAWLAAYRRRGRNLLLAGILLTPLYGAYFAVQLYLFRADSPAWLWAAFLAVVPLVLAFRYLVSECVRDSLE